MVTRDDMLIELGLAPVWRQRRAESPPPAAVGDTPVEKNAQARQPSPVVAIRATLPIMGSAEQRGPNPDPGALDEAMAARAARIFALGWTALVDDIAACTACGLCRTRTRTVPGVGDAKADWLFVGEAPGAEEDARGEPFVGQAGKLLDSMLTAMGITRSANVYIVNVLKCRPPGNRVPEPHEVAACRPYLDRQIALIKPRIIVALGKSAATSLLGSESSVASLRGRLHRYGKIPLLVTYHPAYLLRSLPDKAKAWEDLLLARRTVREAIGTG